MLLDLNNLAVQGNTGTDRPLPANTPAAQSRSAGERSESGQTSAAGPAVVTKISAAALETSRAVNAPEQAADGNRPGDAVRATGSERQQTGPQRATTEPAASPAQRPGIDVVV